MDMPTSTSGTMEMASTASAAAEMSSSVLMSMGGTSGCKTSMFFNWYTIDSCFLSTSWHVKSHAGFFVTCLTAFLLVLSLELIRRLQRSFDLYLRERSTFQQRRSGDDSNEAKEDDDDIRHDEEIIATSPLVESRMRLELPRRNLKLDIMALHSCLRSALFMLQFGVSYCIMLMAMYFNGFVILCILLGAFVGATIFQQDIVQPRYDKLRLADESRADACC